VSELKVLPRGSTRENISATLWAQYVLCPSLSLLAPRNTLYRYTFLEEDLKRVNRDVTPFVILMSHCPFYSSSTTHFDEWQAVSNLRASDTGLLGGGQVELFFLPSDFPASFMCFHFMCALLACLFAKGGHARQHGAALLQVKNEATLVLHFGKHNHEKYVKSTKHRNNTPEAKRTTTKPSVLLP